MFRVVSLQAIAVVLAIAAAGGFFGLQGAVSAGVGGGMCVFPNLLLALYLRFAAHRRGASSASYSTSLFVGEFVKVMLTLGLLALTIKQYAGLHWPSLLIGMVLALQAGFLGFWKKS